MSKKVDMVSREIDKIENEKLADKYMTALRKVQFINELKYGLGAQIKSNPNSVRVIKKSWSERLKSFCKKLFTKL